MEEHEERAGGGREGEREGGIANEGKKMPKEKRSAGEGGRAEISGGKEERERSVERMKRVRRVGKGGKGEGMTLWRKRKRKNSCFGRRKER